MIYVIISTLFQQIGSEQRLSDPSVRIIDASWHLPNVDRSG